ncbi:MAG: response regulator [Deltaproteobacteria bacterium]|nr:response regulator [Deltaproteobacteria bacterium]
MSETPERRPKLLYVDDDFEAHYAFTRAVGDAYELVTAMDAQEGLAVCSREGPFWAVVSDLRMPGLDGVAFLAQVRAHWPTTVRVLFTGVPDIPAAISAVNDGFIFRFITKPCPTELLLKTLEASTEQYRLLIAEKELLERTLLGSVKLMSDVLSVANPAAFGRASRVRQMVSETLMFIGSKNKPAAPAAQAAAYGAKKPQADKPSLPGPDNPRWEVEVASVLSQLGAVSLPAQVAEKLYFGKPMVANEKAMADRVPVVASRLVGNIPRLDKVKQILLYQSKQYDGAGLPPDDVKGDAIPYGSRLIKIVVDYDNLTSQGISKEEALESLRRRNGWYDRAILEVFAQYLGIDDEEIKEVSLAALSAGMVFAEDVIAKNGVLLAAHGLEVTPAIMERVNNSWKAIGLMKPIKVKVKRVAR